MYPLKFEPFLRTMVWGGEKIAPYKHIKTDIRLIGESWEISGVSEHLTSVAAGPLEGRTITELVAEYKDRLVGKKVYAEYGDQFPLLVKFIDAERDLSIQVHPNDEIALRNHGAGFKGKTEMWYVIDADPGACLYCGLKESVTKEQFAAQVAAGTVTDILCKYEVKAGDVFFLPAGRIHSICSGCFVAEIQQTSDLTYRIFDYNRLGLDGKPRQLHVAQAIEAIDYKVLPTYQTAYEHKLDEEVTLVHCPFFTTTLFDLTRPFDKDLRTLDSFVIVMCLSGKGRIIDREEDGRKYEVSIAQGETLLIPASSEGVELLPEGEMKLLCSCIA